MSFKNKRLHTSESPLFSSIYPHAFKDMDGPFTQKKTPTPKSVGVKKKPEQKPRLKSVPLAF